VSKIALTLVVLLSKNVTFESVLSFDFTSAGKLKSLLSTSVCFHLWHEKLTI